MGLFDALENLFSLAKEAADTTNVQKTEEFKAEVNELEQELTNKSSYELLVEFHSIYANSHGDGLISRYNSFESDPQYHAYRNVFTQRRIRRNEVYCPKCEKEDNNIKLGYRYFFISQNDIPNCSETHNNDWNNLTNGTCSCWKCGKNFNWEITEGYYGYEIDIH